MKPKPIEMTEEIILLAIDRMEPGRSYGINIVSKIMELSGIEWNSSTVYQVVDRLAARGLIHSTPITRTSNGRRYGRRPVRSYVLTLKGREVLDYAHRVRELIRGEM